MSFKTCFLLSSVGALQILYVMFPWLKPWFGEVPGVLYILKYSVFTSLLLSIEEITPIPSSVYQHIPLCSFKMLSLKSIPVGFMYGTKSVLIRINSQKKTLTEPFKSSYLKQNTIMHRYMFYYFFMKSSHLLVQHLWPPFNSKAPNVSSPSPKEFQWLYLEIPPKKRMNSALVASQKPTVRTSQ